MCVTLSSLSLFLRWLWQWREKPACWSFRLQVKQAPSEQHVWAALHNSAFPCVARNVFFFFSSSHPMETLPMLQTDAVSKRHTAFFFSERVFRLWPSQHVYTTTGVWQFPFVVAYVCIYFAIMSPFSVLMFWCQIVIGFNLKCYH